MPNCVSLKCPFHQLHYFMCKVAHSQAFTCTPSTSPAINTPAWLQDEAHESKPSSLLRNTVPSLYQHSAEHFSDLLMPSLKHGSSSVIILDIASKMKMRNLKKAAAMCKSKTGVLAGRLLVLASLRRRMATVGAISHRIHALMVATDAGKDLDKALAPRKAKAGGGKPVVLVRRRDATDISDQLALFHQEDGDGGDDGPDWSVHSIFDDENCCYADEYYEGDDDDDDSELLDLCDDGHNASEPSVMDVIRSNRKVEGLEFNVDDEIDQAAGMFITRFRNRMNGSI